MLFMTLFDALAIASISLGISFSAHAHTHHLVLHYSARHTCFSCCFKNFLKIHWNTPRGAVVLCAQNNCQSQPRCSRLTGLLTSVLRYNTNLPRLPKFSLCLVTWYLQSVPNLLCDFGIPSMILITCAPTFSQFTFLFISTGVDFHVSMFFCVVASVSSFRL